MGKEIKIGGQVISPSTRTISENNVFFKDCFTDIEDNSYARSDYFSKKTTDKLELLEPTTNFKRFLKETFNLASDTEIASKFGSNYKCVIKQILGKDLSYIDDNKGKILYISNEEFVKFVAENLKTTHSTFTSILNDVQKGRSIRKATANKAFNFLAHDAVIDTITKADDFEVREFIYKISAKSKNTEHIFQAGSSSRAERGIKIGELLLNDDSKEAKKLLRTSTNVKSIEKIWENFFTEYFHLLFFGCVNLRGQLKISDKLFEEKFTRIPDLLLVNEYGIPVIVELKLHSDNLFKKDKSHNKVSPTDSLAKAISQTYNYMRVLSSSENKEEIAEEIGVDVNYLSLAEGIVVISSEEKILKTTGMTSAQMIKEAYFELAMLNYNLTKIKVITYDLFIKRLKKFKEVIEIKND